MPDDLYAGLAERYDLFFGGFGEHAEAQVAFFRRLFAENGVHRVLDCACGTGNDLHLMHSLGCEVVGSDLSPAMLAQARRNLSQVGIELPLFQADYRELPQHFTEPFDAVLCLSTAIAHMPDEAEIERALISMRAVLRPGGLLVLSQGTADRQWRERPRFLLAFDRPEATRLFVIDYEGRGARYTVLDIMREGGHPVLHTFSVDYAQMPLRDDQERLLRSAGFARVDFFGGYGFEPYDKEQSLRLITVAYSTEERTAV